jgi:hypothetical protein
VWRIPGILKHHCNTSKSRTETQCGQS